MKRFATSKIVKYRVSEVDSQLRTINFWDFYSWEAAERFMAEQDTMAEEVSKETLRRLARGEIEA